MCASTVWNALLPDRRSGDTYTEHGILRAAISRLSVLMRELSKGSGEFASTVCKTVSVGNARRCQKRYCDTLTHVSNANYEGDCSTKAGRDQVVRAIQSGWPADDTNYMNNAHLLALHIDRGKPSSMRMSHPRSSAVAIATTESRRYRPFLGSHNAGLTLMDATTVTAGQELYRRSNQSFGYHRRVSVQTASGVTTSKLDASTVWRLDATESIRVVEWMPTLVTSKQPWNASKCPSPSGAP